MNWSKPSVSQHSRPEYKNSEDMNAEKCGSCKEGTLSFWLWKGHDSGGDLFVAFSFATWLNKRIKRLTSVQPLAENRHKRKQKYAIHVIHQESGPDGIGDYRPRLNYFSQHIGVGASSPEATGDLSYLFRAAPQAPLPMPRKSHVGEVGWGWRYNQLLNSGTLLSNMQIKNMMDDSQQVNTISFIETELRAGGIPPRTTAGGPAC
ncbi:putative protein C4orf45 [Channa argus]|uniref:Uncharacterized protein n=1 Tax=Channa argus TaxID=215402 RepID=A0A6G1PVB2_CHAAH|nr:putative protein C4orf45 [Channa argus]